MIAEFPEKLQFVFQPARFKVAYGGRGSAKSWSFARALLIQAAGNPLRILCARETMKSLADSVHQLLEDQIRDLGLSEFYRIEKSGIYGANGSQFSFAGLKHNVSEIKSFEGVDIVWVEEAQSVSKHSWSVLIPTIRKEGSEIWATYNPDLKTDATHQLFVVHPPPNAIVARVNYDDNPWFPAVLRAEMEHCKATKPLEYEHIWMGSCVNTAEGAIYAEELRQVDKEQRITRVPYDPSRPVDTFWDLGFGDATAVFFAQAGPFEYRIIDYYENSRQPLAHYLKVLQDRGYVFGSHWLPWDARPKQFGSGRSVEELMREAGFNVQIVPKLSVADGINAARTIFPLCWFDAEKCADGLQALRHYRYGVMKTTDSSTREPIHDNWSHGADAWRYFSVAIKQPDLKPPEEAEERIYTGHDGWMS